ncbi:uncharacterized protein QC764_0106710 [Podospora pseudoanserina]|uniref:Uncharacterized protein n=1 Tax=Podospora pseudoanserina TaxID=2609844 RepID=A0ABR0HM40_9PEZI|nr:hypothetical protein QC764_0106710 [Podospora pseudoanserina]
MASNHPTQAQPAKDSAQQEEEKLEDALYHLNQLHLQATSTASLGASAHAGAAEYQTTLPYAPLQPLLNPPFPEAMYAAFMQSVDSTTKELGSFRDALGSPETKAIWNRVNVSQKRDPKGIKQWRAVDDPFWGDPDRKRVKTE